MKCFLLLSFVFFPSLAAAQLLVHGEAAINLFNGENGPSPRVVNRGTPTFGWRLDALADAVIAENIGFLSHARLRENEVITFDFLAVRFTDLTPLGLNVQLGKFDIPFGNLGERRFASRNPLYSLPLMYEYATALPTRGVTEAEFLSRKGRGQGMRLLDFGIYDIGAMVFGEAGILGYAAALTNGTVSATANTLQNTNADFGRMLRLTLTPIPGLTIGASYGGGAWMSDAAAADTTSVKRTLNAADYQQHNAAIDVEFSRGHLEVYGQGMYSTYRVPFDYSDIALAATAWYAEAKYTLLPRLFAAMRVGAIHFLPVDLAGRSQAWDNDILEAEFGIGYKFDRNALCKAVYRISRTDGADPHDNLMVMQISVRY